MLDNTTTPIRNLANAVQGLIEAVEGITADHHDARYTRVQAAVDRARRARTEVQVWLEEQR